MIFEENMKALPHSFRRIVASLVRTFGEAAALVALLVAFASCSSRPTSVPATFTALKDTATIFPDYIGVTIPPNIAPLNFMISDADADAFVVEMKGASASLVSGAAEDGKLDLDSVAWRQLLTEAKGTTLTVNVYAQRTSGWVRYQPFTIAVAEEPIDGFLSYRLIEPGYELYRQIGLYQRNLTTFDEAVIYENNRTFDNDDNHCVNCHNYQAYDTERMLFHVRASHGGTVVTHGSEAHKIAIKHDSILGAGVYPSWHPTLPLVAFSTNKTGQVFHMYHAEKIEVLDEASDLLLYDADANVVSNVLRTSDSLETFPCWSPDGKRLYYCCAAMPASLLEDYSERRLALCYDSLLYDLYSMAFDPATRTFGPPRLEVNASAEHKSVSVPRVSPDGRYLLYTLGDYGQFHIWHKSADLWVKEISDEPGEGEDLERQRPLTAANAADQPDSYHSWSSSGRWIAFASRRDDGNFSRVYITYFDEHGQAHKPFLLPQRDPEYNLLLLKSFNVPELTRSAVRVSRETLDHVVLHTEAETATYR